MQQMNHVLSLRAQDGFYVDAFTSGVNHRPDNEGHTQHNLYYNILLKRVVPLLPRRLPAPQQMPLGGGGHMMGGGGHGGHMGGASGSGGGVGDPTGLQRYLSS